MRLDFIIKHSIATRVACLVASLPSVALAVSLQVDIKGVPPALANNVRADLHLQQATTEEKLTETRIRNLYQLAQEQITATLQAKGYYHSKINGNLTKQPGATSDQDKWLATFVIDPGRPTKIQSVNVAVEGPAQNNKKLKPFLATPKLVQGEVLVHENYEDTKDELLANLNAAGYLQAEFRQSVIEVNRNDYTAQIKFVIASGPQYTFGKITFVDSDYPDDFLLKFARFRAGDAYDLQKLMDFQKNLESADLFSKIRFDPLNDLENPKDTVVPIQVRLTRKPKNRYTGSVGYGTDTGVRGSLGWLHRRTSTPGHKILSNLYLSQVRSNARVNYIIPGSKPATDKYVFGVLGQFENFEELFSRKAEISASKIMKRGKLESMYGLWYFTETFQIATALPTLNRKYLLPTAKWVWID
ncbi:MAG TPA: POTRA domain-containing protein, partial [Gammaproteobacteria bacterium]|nr:POTRA domain-containing protein [Gammaproteobacteria bacterium]